MGYLRGCGVYLLIWSGVYQKMLVSHQPSKASATEASEPGELVLPTVNQVQTALPKLSQGKSVLQKSSQVKTVLQESTEPGEVSAINGQQGADSAVYIQQPGKIVIRRSYLSLFAIMICR